MNAELLNEYRIFNLSAQTFLPLVEDMHQSAYETLITAYRKGNTDLVAQVAKCESLYSLKEEIITKAKLHETYAAKETT